MGWLFDDPDLPACYEHEGGVVALTFRTKDRTSGLFRELNYPDDATYEREAIARIQAGCRCGWRSEYFVPRWGQYTGEIGAAAGFVFRLPRWSPYSAWVTEEDEERCHALWTEHMRQAVPGLVVAT